MPPVGYISAAAYARRCGVTPGAICHRIRKGQLDDAVHREAGRVWIDPQRADALFLHRGRPCNSRALQIELRLMAAVDEIAAELAGQPRDYCMVAMLRWADQIIGD